MSHDSVIDDDFPQMLSILTVSSIVLDTIMILAWAFRGAFGCFPSYVCLFFPLCFGTPAFIAMTFAAIYFAAVGLRRNTKRAVWPLVANVATLLVVLFVPFEETRLEWIYSSNLKGYRQIVRLVEAAEIQPDESGYAKLPPEYHRLSSCGGEIMIDTRSGITRVFFFTSRDIFCEFAGYMYRSDDGFPEADDFGCSLGSWREIRQKAPHWFFCRHSED